MKVSERAPTGLILSMSPLRKDLYEHALCKGLPDLYRFTVCAIKYVLLPHTNS